MKYDFTKIFVEASKQLWNVCFFEVGGQISLLYVGFEKHSLLSNIQTSEDHHLPNKVLKKLGLANISNKSCK